MPQIGWPTTVIMVSVVVVAGMLAGMHVLTPDWIERTLTAVLGFVAGTALGIRVGNGRGSSRPPPSMDRSG